MKTIIAKKTRVFVDSWVMFKRCLLTSLRNPEALITAIIMPAAVMWLFSVVLGNIVDVGDHNYIDFILPGIILQTVAQGTFATAISVSNDMTRGIIDRFRSMAISRSAVLIGHALASIVRNIITTTIVIGMAFALGFRSQAGFVDWLVIAGILILFMLSVTWIAVVCGLSAKTPESTVSMLYILAILPYISSGFAPTDTISGWIKWFVKYQPMTPIIDSLRARMLNIPAYDALPAALIWSVGITVVAFIVALQIYKRKLS